MQRNEWTASPGTGGRHRRNRHKVLKRSFIENASLNLAKCSLVDAQHRLDVAGGLQTFLTT
jgi:hypothetical protein